MIDADTLSQHSTGTESERGHDGLERPGYLPIYQASHEVDAVPSGPRRSVFSPGNWPADASTRTQEFAPTTQFSSPSFQVPSTSRGPPIPSHVGNNSPVHFGYNASPGAHPVIFEDYSQRVTMPTLTGYVRYSRGLIDAYSCHVSPSFGFVDDNYMAEYHHVIPSTMISMPVVSTYHDANASGYVDPTLPSDPDLRQSSRYYPTMSFSSPAHIDSGSYSPSSSTSSGNHSLVSPPLELPNQIHPQPTITNLIDELHTLTVSFEVVEFPSISNAGELSFFFRCCWDDCSIWMTCSKEAVKDHLTRIHNVEFKKHTDGPERCKWAGCSSSPKRSGLVRHFLTHLGLRWSCSVCKRSYTRTDSVKSHTRRELGCQLARAISIPSSAAYRARINEDSTVTLTKVVALQP